MVEPAAARPWFGNIQAVCMLHVYTTLLMKKENDAKDVLVGPCVSAMGLRPRGVVDAEECVGPGVFPPLVYSGPIKS
ncbi:hypothetical protein VTI28DRAFT_1818 [Corynascus sepedonium]